MNMFLPAVKKQYVQADFETSYVTNKDQLTGNKLIELRAILYRHRNIFGGGELFRFQQHPVSVSNLHRATLHSLGLNLQTGVTIPRFIDIGILKLANRVGLSCPTVNIWDIKRTAGTDSTWLLSTTFSYSIIKIPTWNERNTQQENWDLAWVMITPKKQKFLPVQSHSIDYLSVIFLTVFLNLCTGIL